MKKRIIPLMVCLLVVVSLATHASAADITEEKEYKPLDLIIVMDTSGSMLYSDENRLTPDAVNLLMNQIPKNECRMGIVTFNTKAEKQYIAGSQGLVKLDENTSIEHMGDIVNNVIYKGGTGIGNALLAATELLQDYSDDEHSKGIMLFTDGVNDFGVNVLELAACNENETKALKWAKTENCPVYCLGYNYTTKDGKSSMGENGEGLVRLQNISNSTGGLFKQVHDISEARGIFETFLADLLDVKVIPVPDIPGDGEYHECIIPVSPSVSELDISLVGGKSISMKDAEIHLYNPSHEEIELINSGKVRYYVGKTAINIKVVMPMAGDWLLTVKGVFSDDMIHINLLEHFNINLTSRFIYPEGNPEGVAYSNDIIGIRTWLSFDGNALTDEALYDTVKSAEATCVPRANPKEKKVISLTRDGLAFKGEFRIPQDSFYDVHIRLEWDTFYREMTCKIGSNNKPVYFVKDFEDIKVNKGKSIEISDLYTYAKDDEDDSFEFYIKDIVDKDACNIDFSGDGDTLKITGVKGWWAKTLVTLAVKDAQGNEKEQTFTVSVGDPWAAVLIVAILTFIAAFVLILLKIIHDKSLKIKGELYCRVFQYDDTDDPGAYFNMDFGEEPITVSLTQLYKVKKKRNVEGLLSEIRRLLNGCQPNSKEDDLLKILNGSDRSKDFKALCVGANKSKIIGSPTGASFIIKNNKSTKYLYIDRSDSGRIVIDDGSSFSIIFKKRSGLGNRSYKSFEIKCGFKSNVRKRRTNNRRNRHRRAR